MFEGRFLESKQTDVAIRNVDGAVMKMLIDFAYRGRTECPASVENVVSLYVAAHYIQFDKIFRRCSDWLKGHVDESNCISMGIVGDRYGDSDLLRIADRLAAVTISVLAETEDFLLLSAEHLSRIISHDELGVKVEDEVLTILQKWMKHDEEARRAQVETLSTFVRFPLLDFKESSDVLSDLDLVSHYRSSGGSCQRRVGCDGVLLVTGGLEWKRCESNLCSEYDFCTCKDVSDEARVYEPNSNIWTTFPSLKVGMCRHTIVTSNEVLYALGGYTEVHSDQYAGVDVETAIVQRYDAGQRQWVDDVQCMSCTSHEIVCCNNRIYGMSIGTKTSAEDEMICEVFDSGKNTWIPVSCPENALSCILASLENEIVAIGCEGDYGEFGYTKYDPSENRWCKFKSFRQQDFIDMMRRCLYVTTGDRLYIKDGYNPDCAALIFDRRLDYSFSFVKDFFPFSTCYGLAYDLESKRMYMFNDKQIAVYDERANRWDVRDCPDLGFDSFSCVVVERKLMLDYV